MVSRSSQKSRSGRSLGWLPAAAALLFVFLSCARSSAQPPQPLLSHVFPAGGQRGKTIEATVTGANLQGASVVRITGPGVAAKVLQAEKPDSARIAVTIAPDAELGERDLRVLTAGGVSNRCRFVVGELPEVNEVEPNNEKTQAQQLPALPVLVNGQLLDTDRDYFRFAGKAGQTLVCALQGRPLLPYIPDAVPGWLDACLTLYDSDGRELVTADDYRLGPDPVLFFTVPKDGEYVLEVRDILYRGRPSFVYRLSMGALPFATSIFPLGAQNNSVAAVELRGVNLPAPTLDLACGVDSPLRRLMGLTAQSAAWNPLLFAAGDVPEVRETEPNDTLAQANRVAVPVTINGRIERRGDNDYFIFAAQAGQALAMEVHARRLRSPLDSILYLYNATGQELARNDDWMDPDPSAAMEVQHVDSRLVYTFPAAGDYVLRIKDAQLHGGEEYGYRLTIAPHRPDFAVLLSPDNPRLAKGDTAILTVRAVRKDGFGGEIRVTACALPPGFAACEAVIPAGQETARLTVTAPAAAANGIVTPTFVSTGLLGKDPLVRPVLPAEEIMQAFSIKHNVPTQELALAVIEPVLLTLSTGLTPDKPLEARQESEVQVVVKAVRLGGAKGDVALNLDGPPPGVTLKTAPAVIPADKEEIAVVLNVAKQTPPGQHNLFLTGTLNTGKETATRFAPAVPLKVLPAP
jgi:hypothetical protein